MEIFDTAIAIMAGLMIIPAVFAFSGGDPDTLQAGPALMFITIPKVFASMGFGTQSVSCSSCWCVCGGDELHRADGERGIYFQDELRWSRKKATVIVGVIMLALGTLSSLGYGVLGGVKLIGHAVPRFLRFPDEFGHDADRSDCDLSAHIPRHWCEKDRGGGAAWRRHL